MSHDAGRTVAVVGPADPNDDRLLEIAYDVGAGLAAAGCVLVTGGLGGVMAAASRGARQAGGLVVGILPGDDPAGANEWVTVAIPTGLGEARNALVVRSARAVIAVGGSWGTLSEVALARRRGLPVVAVHGWRIIGPGTEGVIEATDAASALATVLGPMG
jgi:uncharacterized protein (TIGR00725 family)